MPIQRALESTVPLVIVWHGQSAGTGDHKEQLMITSNWRAWTFDECKLTVQNHFWESGIFVSKSIMKCYVRRQPFAYDRQPVDFFENIWPTYSDVVVAGGVEVRFSADPCAHHVRAAR